MGIFKKKKEVSTTDVTFYDHQGTKLYHGSIQNMNIPEAVILEKSVQFFSDPEPCYIHRGAVVVRLYAEIEDFLQNIETKGLLSSKLDDFHTQSPADSSFAGENHLDDSVTIPKTIYFKDMPKDLQKYFGMYPGIHVISYLED